MAKYIKAKYVIKTYKNFHSRRVNATVFGYPMTVSELEENLNANCIPLSVKDWNYNNYMENFLPERRKLMARKIQNYYKSL